MRDKTPHRITLLFPCEREPGTANLQEMLNKVQSLKRAIDGGLANVYDPIVQDPTLVRAAQLACLRLRQTLPSGNKAEYATKMYVSMERRFNYLLRERTQMATKQTR